MILLVSLLNRVNGIGKENMYLHFLHPKAALNISFLQQYKQYKYLDPACNGTIVGRVRNRKLNELSGLAESHRFPGIFYAIEDSGNEPVVYIINKDGSLRGEVSFLISSVTRKIILHYGKII